MGEYIVKRGNLGVTYGENICYAVLGCALGVRGGGHDVSNLKLFDSCLGGKAQAPA